MRLTYLRTLRVFLCAGILINVVGLVLDVLAGSIFAVAPLVMIPALIACVVLTTRVIRRQRAAIRPRPDYAVIARMEREVWGRTFEHDGAPGMSLSQLHAEMDDLAERATARMRPCIGCGSGETRVGGKCLDCYQRAKLHRERSS